MITYKLKKKFSGEKQNTFNDWETNSSISQVDLAFFFLSHVMIIKVFLVIEHGGIFAIHLKGISGMN